MKKALFVDRDGVINVSPPQWEYVLKWGQFNLIEPTIDLLKQYQKKGYLIVVITNQLGVAKGLMTLDDLNLIHDNMCKLLMDKGVKIDGVYFCPHWHTGDCDCRKPKPGLIFKAAKELNIDVANSVMIGDRQTDIECGKNAGCKETWLFELTNNVINLTKI